MAMWSQPTPATSLPAVEAWRILPSSPSVASTSGDSNGSLWVTMGMSEVQIPSPTPAYSAPFSAPGLYYSSPTVTAGISAALPLPSMLAPAQCGVHTGYGNFGWDRYQEYTSIM
ncbi:unnamed protein product [Parascedosporium putredinis]|nr:unnamed protein product [Parascedosporium putredinis]CAI8004371.1 unnamed protein product [Parascedosporium putredinis]